MARDFGVQEITDDLQPSFNVAPTDKVAVVLNNGVKQLVAMRWGLVPFWATDPKIASKHINARAETLTVKPAFKDAFKRRRCLVVADGFFEWQKQGATKIPMFIHLEPERPFGFAGLYEIWTPPLGEKLVTCTIITTEANELVRPIHDRMPVILDPDSYDLWLDPGMKDVRAATELLKPYDARLMRCYPVSSRINSVANDDEACSTPVALAQIQNRLFL